MLQLPHLYIWKGCHHRKEICVPHSLIWVQQDYQNIRFQKIIHTCKVPFQIHNHFIIIKIIYKHCWCHIYILNFSFVRQTSINRITPLTLYAYNIPIVSNSLLVCDIKVIGCFTSDWFNIWSISFAKETMM